jgi:hypothetical protein
VLVVDGDPRPSPAASESYYLLHALRPGGGEGSPFAPRVVAPEDLGRVPLDSYEAVVLLNVAEPPAAPLASSLKAGKPLLVFLGDRVSPGAYRRLPFLPCLLGEVRQGPPGGLRVGRAALPPGSGEGPGKGAFFRYYRLEGGGKPLLTLANGDPLLVEGAWGRGRVFLWASSADGEWTDLPLHAAYVPWIQGLLKEAVGLSKAPLPPARRIGEPPPAGAGVPASPEAPGVRRVSRPEGEARQAVNVPPEESDLRRVTAAELRRRFGAGNVRVFDAGTEAPELPAAGRSELWPYVLGALLLLLGAETAVASRS